MENLRKKRILKDFEEKIKIDPQNSCESKQATVNNLKKFVQEELQSTVDQVCQELIRIKKKEGEEEYEDALYPMLQNWIEWNIKNGLNANTIKTRFSIIKDILYFLGVKTNLQDIKQRLKFPKIMREEKYPLQKKQLRKIVNDQVRNPKRQALYLALSSSGMRIGEALALKKNQFDFSKKRIMIRLSPEQTKTSAGRTVIVSKECEEKIMSYFEELSDSEFVFTDSTASLKSRVRAETQALTNTLKRLGIEQRYSSNNVHKITSHSFRAYFFTKATRKHNENYAHKMTGHGGYLMQYDRYTDEEKVEMYLELEPELIIDEQIENELKISDLQDQVSKMSGIEEKLFELRQEIARIDKETIQKLTLQGAIVN